MSAKERIARLETLLGRVLARATEPRPARNAAMSVAAAPVAAAAAAEPLDDDDEGDKKTLPPPGSGVPVMVVRPPVSPPPPEISVDVDVVVEVPEVRLESRARLIAAQPAGAEADAEAEEDEARAQAEAEDQERAALSRETAAPSGEGRVSASEPRTEEAPVSSRRPVAVQASEPEPAEQARQLEELAFGARGLEASPPRHTPPPESGRLPAAPVVEFEGDITGVRDTSDFGTPAVPPAEVAEQTRPEAFAGAASEVAPNAPPAAALQPQVVSAEIAPSGAVAEYHGSVQVDTPKDLGELFDSALTL